MKTSIKFSVLLLFFALAESCTSARIVSAENADNMNISRYKTYNFYAEDDTLSKQLAWGLGAAKLAIADEMKKRGFQQGGSDADLLINIGMVVREQVETRQTNFQQDAPRYLGQRRYSWKSEEVETGRYNQGTISVHLVDGKENKMIWKGVVESVVPRRKEKVQQAIREGIQKLFTRLPSTGK
ncbi:MAG TPA: DUF4136 domain-containing protein [Segetibacter sp.]|jgi:hypothetical protein